MFVWCGFSDWQFGGMPVRLPLSKLLQQRIATFLNIWWSSCVAVRYTSCLHRHQVLGVVVFSVFTDGELVHMQSNLLFLVSNLLAFSASPTSPTRSIIAAQENGDVLVAQSGVVCNTNAWAFSALELIYSWVEFCGTICRFVAILDVRHKMRKHMVFVFVVRLCGYGCFAILGVTSNKLF